MLLSITAVAFSCALLIVVGSLFEGFISTLENTSNKFTGDIILTPKGKIKHHDRFIEMLKADPDIVAATPVLSSQGLLHVGKGNVRGVNIWGIDPETRVNVTGIQETLVIQNELDKVSFGKSENPKVLKGFVGIGLLAKPDELTDKYDIEAIKKEFIGKEIALTTGAVVQSDNNTILTSADRTSFTNFKRKRVRLEIADVIFTGIFQLDNRFVYLPLDGFSKKLYGQDDLAGIMHIKIAEGVDPADKIPAVGSIWAGFARNELGWSGYAISSANIETSKQMQAAHVKELYNQMKILLATFGIVSLAVVLLIFCVFYMIVMTKVKDIAIIKSFGISSSGVAMLFVVYGFFVGVVGAAVGFGLGYWFTLKVNEIEQWVRVTFGLKLWESSVYLFTKAPSVIDWSTVAWVLPAAIVAAAIGAVIPAIAASKIRPVKILQYE